MEFTCPEFSQTESMNEICLLCELLNKSYFNRCQKKTDKVITKEKTKTDKVFDMLQRGMTIDDMSILIEEDNSVIIAIITGLKKKYNVQKIYKLKGEQ